MNPKTRERQQEFRGRGGGEHENADAWETGEHLWKHLWWKDWSYGNHSEADFLHSQQRVGVNMFRAQWVFLLIVVLWLQRHKAGCKGIKRKQYSSSSGHLFYFSPRRWMKIHMACPHVWLRKRMWSARAQPLKTRPHNLQHPEIYLKTIHIFNNFLKVGK